ncbi:MAG TPA: YgeY family selenium metabolism-linked hydrolase [Candidatus Eremiobacteraeota bacterium]|nr:MAG: putative succinyl-diaminopimelate desuccinylase [bacterium ADurb.Bin363]HPZ07146.1 YgeY family selenium metabolism-linked hydrolase [Candidatus Eremiobacteraeota bacterium]
MKHHLLEAVKKYENEIINFLREMVAIPGESRDEKRIIERIKQEMEKVEFDDIEIDDMGNILGRIGNGKRIIAMDCHVDTVGIGNPAQWKVDPYKGMLHEGKIYGRGSVDQRAGMAALVYGVKLIKDFNLFSDFTLYITGTVQEEDCDGLCWQYIINEKGLKPECVVITEPTDLNIYRGHRGRIEIGVTTTGKACHASAPERGKNAIYSMNKIIREIEKLNDSLAVDPFLGKGTVVVTNITCKSPSLCAVPDECYIHLDRRLTKEETKEIAIKEIEKAAEKAGVEAKIEVLTYNLPGYKGLVYPTERYFPTWLLPEDHLLLKSSINTFNTLFDKLPVTSKWIFSTNGVATMGMHKIPTIGFGPGNEQYAHSSDEHVPVEHVLKAAAWYALFPSIYVKTLEKGE